MTPEEQDAVAEWKTANPDPGRIGLVVCNESSLAGLKPFTEFIEEQLRVPIRYQQTDSNQPALVIRDRITYHALPRGPELKPFLQALTGKGSIRIPAADTLQTLSKPVRLTLYIAADCPFCPTAVSQVIALAQVCPQIRIRIIDGTLFPDMAETDKVQSAPTLLYKKYRWSHPLDIREVIQTITLEDPARIGTATLREIIHNGDASGVASLMIEHQTIFPAFLELLAHEKWPVRLGAMVVAEEIADRSSDLAKALTEPIFQILPDQDDPVKGDLLYVVGETGTPAALPRLRLILEDTVDAEMQTIIQEAIQSIQERYGVG